MKKNLKPINDNEEEPEKEEIKEEEEETDPDDPLNAYSKTIEEAEDNDGENRFAKEEDKMTKGGAAVTILKSMIGVGILNLPVCFRTLGLIGGIVVILISMLLTICSIYFLMKCKDITQRYGYSMYAKICFGSFGTFTMKASVVALTFLMGCLYLRVFGGIFKTLVELFVTPDDSIYFHPTFYILVVFFVLMPLMFKEDITELRKFSFIGVVSVFIFVGSIVIVFLFKFFNNEIEPFSTAMLYPDGSKLQLFVAATSLIDTFSFQTTAFPIYLSIKERSSSKMIKAVAKSAVTAATIYCITGTLGFMMYRQKLETVVIQYLTLDIHKYKSTNLPICAVLFICTLTFYLNAMLSFPLVFFALKKNLLTLIGFLRKRIFKLEDDEGNEDNEKTLAVSMAKTTVIMESAGKRMKILVALLSYIAILLCTLSVTNLLTITGIVGSTVANIISMIAPSMFIFQLSEKSFCSFEKVLSKIVFSIGFTILMTFFYTKIMVFF